MQRALIFLKTGASALEMQILQHNMHDVLDVCAAPRPKGAKKAPRGSGRGGVTREGGAHRATPIPPRESHPAAPCAMSMCASIWPRSPCGGGGDGRAARFSVICRWRGWKSCALPDNGAPIICATWSHLCVCVCVPAGGDLVLGCPDRANADENRGGSQSSSAFSLRETGKQKHSKCTLNVFSSHRNKIKYVDEGDVCAAPWPQDGSDGPQGARIGAGYTGRAARIVPRPSLPEHPTPRHHAQCQCLHQYGPGHHAEVAGMEELRERASGMHHWWCDAAPRSELPAWALTGLRVHYARLKRHPSLPHLPPASHAPARKPEAAPRPPCTM